MAIQMKKCTRKTCPNTLLTASSLISSEFVLNIQSFNSFNTCNSHGKTLFLYITATQTFLWNNMGYDWRTGLPLLNIYQIYYFDVERL